MTSKKFWRLYNKWRKKNKNAGFLVIDHHITGDHGFFEIAVFKNEAGKWCIEETIERSNNCRHDEYETEKECFERLLIKLKLHHHCELEKLS